MGKLTLGAFLRNRQGEKTAGAVLRRATWSASVSIVARNGCEGNSRQSKKQQRSQHLIQKKLNEKY